MSKPKLAVFSANNKSIAPGLEAKALKRVKSTALPLTGERNQIEAIGSEGEGKFEANLVSKSGYRVEPCPVPPKQEKNESVEDAD